MNGWKIASSYIVGQGHIVRNIPCQDRTYQLIDKQCINRKSKKRYFKNRSAIEVNKKIVDYKNNFYGLALADGAGSCIHSDIGAELITKKILHYIKNNFDDLLNDSNLQFTLTTYIEGELREKEAENSIIFKDLSSTLLFVAIKDKKFIIGHIGDGVIGMLDDENNIQTISKPENGEYSNSTYFTTSIHYPERLRLLKGTLKKGVGFILMSDGTEESLYNKEKECLSDTNINIINWLEKNNERDVEKALFSNLEQVISKRTSDDCSIGIMKKISK
jgi:serine/threonine protein phosphatase PrpC